MSTPESVVGHADSCGQPTPVTDGANVQPSHYQEQTKRVLAPTILALAALSAAPAAAKDKKPIDRNKVSCRSVEETGSIMNGKKVCHTHAEWQTLDSRLDDTLRNMNGSGVGRR